MSSSAGAANNGGKNRHLGGRYPSKSVDSEVAGGGSASASASASAADFLRDVEWRARKILRASNDRRRGRGAGEGSVAVSAFPLPRESPFLEAREGTGGRRRGAPSSSGAPYPAEKGDGGGGSLLPPSDSLAGRDRVRRSDILRVLDPKRGRCPGGRVVVTKRQWAKSVGGGGGKKDNGERGKRSVPRLEIAVLRKKYRCEECHLLRVEEGAEGERAGDSGARGGDARGAATVTAEGCFRHPIWERVERAVAAANSRSALRTEAMIRATTFDSDLAHLWEGAGPIGDLRRGKLPEAGGPGGGGVRCSRCPSPMHAGSCWRRRR